MIKFTVKSSKKRRLTYRLLGLFLMIFGACQVSLFVMGYGRKHIIGTLFCVFLLVYGFYLFLHSVKKQSYDIVYEFDQDEIRITHKRGKSVYTYDMVDDVSLIVPENEFIYSIIHLKIGKDSYILPFSYKKETCDKIYTFLNERVTSKQIEKQGLEV